MADNVKELIDGLVDEAYGPGATDAATADGGEPAAAVEGEETVEETADGQVAPLVYETVIPDELAVELDLEDEPVDEDPDDDDDVWDPRLIAEREKRRELEKRLALTERQAKAAAEARWRDEATRVFPLLEEEDRDELIGQSRSHREFLRLAKARHDQYVRVANRVQKEVTAHLEQLREQTVDEAREEAARAWGRPSVGQAEPPRKAQESAYREQSRRKTMSLADQIKERMTGRR